MTKLLIITLLAGAAITTGDAQAAAKKPARALIVPASEASPDTLTLRISR